MLRKLMLLPIVFCNIAHASDPLCSSQAKEGKWESVKVFDGYKRSPVDNILISVPLGVKYFSMKLDKLAVNASSSEVIDAIGEPPTQVIFKPTDGNGRLVWIFESMGTSYGTHVNFYNHCINEISIQSFSTGNIKKSHSMFVKTNKIP